MPDALFSVQGRLFAWFLFTCLLKPK